MILVTGGLGFIGSHTVKALQDAGEECVVVQRRAASTSPVLEGSDVVVERVDITDLDAVRSAGDRHPITGIVHLAGSMPWPLDPSRPVEQARESLGSLFNLVALAQEWGVRRVGMASTIGVYGGSGATGALREDVPVSLAPLHLIPTFKKVSELLGGFFADVTDVEVVHYRISGTWGPLGHLPDPFFAAPSLVQAAAQGTRPDLSGLRGRPTLEDALDLCYVKDTGRAIAALQLADRLRHPTYNVASGRSTSNADVIAAIRTVVPDAEVDLPSGGHGNSDHLDITRLREDTGFEPEWDLARATADYLAWFRAGHER